ncbi:Hypothetical predicted protein [Podarcis lilfordi]|uniref:Uncharacterized protein n=1 Tax=Podarcis lilfordi TaxID=74358 RepID=A0AA35PQB9_9SAUR|nr:Hypothetical predicted protein [Podarcis lilfordi]
MWENIGSESGLNKDCWIIRVLRRRRQERCFQVRAGKSGASEAISRTARPSGVMASNKTNKMGRLGEWKTLALSIKFSKLPYCGTETTIQCWLNSTGREILMGLSEQEIRQKGWSSNEQRTGLFPIMIEASPGCMNLFNYCRNTNPCLSFPRPLDKHFIQQYQLCTPEMLLSKKRPLFAICQKRLSLVNELQTSVLTPRSRIRTEESCFTLNSL